MTRAIAVAIFLACMAVNIRRLCPDVFADDSPETVTACVTLGIGHPPGDPLLTLAGRLAANLPVGGPAFRINLLSAACAAALATAGWWLVAARFAAPAARYAAAAAAISLTLANPILAQQAAEAKGAVYTLNGLLLMGVLAGAVKRRPPLAALAAGLIGGHHWMTALAFTPVLLLGGLRGSRARSRAVALAAVPMALGLSLWLVLPIRAAAPPALNWGAVTSARRLLDHVSRRTFLVKDFAANPRTAGVQLAAGVTAVLTQTGLPGLLLGFAGGVWLLAEAPAALWLPFAAGGFGLACAAVYLNLPPALYRLFPAYLLPCWILAIPVALTGAAALAAGRNWQRGLLALCCLAAPVLQAEELGRRAIDRYTWSPDLGRALLAPLPKDAGLVLVSDLDTFPVWEQQLVRQQRRDILVVNAILLRHGWYRRELVSRGAPPALLAPVTAEAALGILLRDTRRAWFSAAVPIAGTPPGFRRIPFHLLFHLSTVPAPARLPREYSYRGFFERLPRRPEPSAVLTSGYSMECLKNLLAAGMSRR